MNLRTTIVSLLAVVLVGWFLRHADLGDVWAQVRHANGGLLVVGFVCVMLTYWARAVRWRYLLAPVGKTTFRSVLRATVIGFAALAILPARMGDVLRPYLLARREGLPTSATFATIVLERVLDLIAVLVLLAVYVWGFSGSSLPDRLLRPIEVSAAIAAAAAAGLLVVMWILATHPEKIGTLAGTAARVLPGRWSDRIGRLASTFSSGFAAARDPKALLMGVLWSFPLWLAIAAEAWAVTVAFGIDMPFTGAFLLQSLLVIGVAVPTPGGVGSYHEAYRIGVTAFFGAPNDRAVAAAIVTHAISFVPVVLLGIVFMAQDGLSVRSLKDLAGAARDKDEKERPHTDEVPILRPSGR
ncbi:MAG TPA: lysylphosphatidylglycerol synthase transmembrane domain-containing protein [Vicinamibacterales bacterium]|nr:lysylphosphatidylglycerol synthase transmembrane domain-containing protein [Vicinamibacterales bacterium]